MEMATQSKAEMRQSACSWQTNLSNQIPIWRASGAVGAVAVSADPQHNRSTETPGKYVSVATTVDQGNASATGLTVDFTVNNAATGTNITDLVVINPGFGYSTSSVLNVTGHETTPGNPLRITVTQAQTAGTWEIGLQGGTAGGGGIGDVTAVVAGDGIAVQDSAGPVITVNTNNFADGGIIYRGTPNQNALDLSASDIQGTLAVTDGGTGLSTTPTDGQLLIGDGTDADYNLATLTAGNGVAITNARSSITIDADAAPDPDKAMGH